VVGVVEAQASLRSWLQEEIGQLLRSSKRGPALVIWFDPERQWDDLMDRLDTHVRKLLESYDIELD